MTTHLCPCESLLSYNECHGRLEGEYYSAPKGETLFYRPPASWTAKTAGAIARRHTYDVRVRGDGQWEFRLAGPVRFIRHYPVVRPADAERLAFFRKRLENCSTWLELEETVSVERSEEAYQRHRVQDELKRPEELDTFQQDMTAVLACPSADDLPDSVHAAGVFLLDRFHQGSIDLVWKDEACVSQPSLISILAQNQLLSVSEIRDSLFSGRGPFGTWYLTLDPGPYFAVLRQVGYPSVNGFELFGGEFGFVVDYGADVDFQSLEVLDRRLRTAGAQVFAGTEQFSIRKFTTGLASRHRLRVWLSRRLNNLFAQLGYLGTFADPPTGTIRPLRQWKDLLTVRDILSITELLLTTSDPNLLRLLFFDLLDRYRGLGGRSVRDLASATFLIHTVVPAIDPQLAEAREAVQFLLEEGWKRVVDGVWEGIYSKSIRASNQITLGDGKKLHKQAFASEVLNALRNTRHGYDSLRSREFERVLAYHHGVLPDAVRDLTLGLWFGLLSSPALFWGKRARLNLMEARRGDSS